QNVKTFNDENVGTIDFDPLIRDYIIDEVRIDWRARRASPSLYVRQKPQQRREVVAFRKALLLHQAFTFQDGIRKQKSISCNKVNLWHVWPSRQQCLQHTGRR